MTKRFEVTVKTGSVAGAAYADVPAEFSQFGNIVSNFLTVPKSELDGKIREPQADEPPASSA